MSGPHVGMNRAMSRPLINMPRMQPQAYNLATQAGMGGMNPGGIPMQRGGGAQAHHQQQVFAMTPILFCCKILLLCFVCRHLFHFNAVEKKRYRNGDDWIPSTAEIKTFLRFTACG